MINIEEIPVEKIKNFWDIHFKYLVDDGIITDDEDMEYFSGEEYRGILESHMKRSTDRHHIVYFTEDNKRVGAASFCNYQSEDGKCFILDFWVFPEYRGNGMGHRCFDALEDKVGVHYGEWRHRNREEDPYRYTWYDVIRDDIEEGLAHAASMEELIGYLREEGYEVKNGKYLSLRPPGRERAVRTGRLGEAYGKEELIRRIRERGTAHDKGTSRITYGNRYEVWYLLSNKKAEHKTWKMTPIQRQFYRRWHHTYFLRKPGRRNYRRYREDIVEVNKIADALAYLVKHDIRNAEGLGKRETELESRSKQVSNSIRRLKAGMKTGSSDPEELKELERLKETRREIRKEQKRLEDIRRLYHQEKERVAAGDVQNRHREHTRITIHRKLFGRMDLKERYAARIPGKGGACVLFPKKDCYMYESGDILSVFLYDEKTYSTCDRDGNNIGKITGRDLKGHYEDKTTSKEDRAADRRNMGGQKT